MPDFKQLIKSYLWLIILCGLIALGALAFWVNADYQERKNAAEITDNQVSAQNAVTAADTLEKQAVSSQVERQTEDAVRTRVIQPKLETARRRSAQSAQSLNDARRKYSNEKTNTSRLSSSTADNCRELQSLFANVRFDDCADAK